MASKWLLVSIACLVVIVLSVLYYLSTSGVGGEAIPYPSVIGDALKDKPLVLRVRVIGFDNGGFIPSNLTCDGGDYSPTIIVDNIPNGTVSIAIVLYDPDAPGGVFYHWIIYNVRVNGSKVVIPGKLPREKTVDIGFQSVNDFGKYGYGGPCPPPGHGRHRYVFLALALDTLLDTRDYRGEEFLRSIRDHVIGYGVYYGVYER